MITLSSGLIEGLIEGINVLKGDDSTVHSRGVKVCLYFVLQGLIPYFGAPDDPPGHEESLFWSKSIDFARVIISSVDTTIFFLLWGPCRLHIL